MITHFVYGFCRQRTDAEPQEDKSRTILIIAASDGGLLATVVTDGVRLVLDEMLALRNIGN